MCFDVKCCLAFIAYSLVTRQTELISFTLAEGCIKMHASIHQH
jgi:hypothetical protein